MSIESSHPPIEPSELMIGDRVIFDTARSVYGFCVQRIDQHGGSTAIPVGGLAKLSSRDGYDEVISIFSPYGQQEQDQLSTPQLAMVRSRFALGEKVCLMHLLIGVDAPVREFVSGEVTGLSWLRDRRGESR
jgi:hypothetical protein